MSAEENPWSADAHAHIDRMSDSRTALLAPEAANQVEREAEKLGFSGVYLLPAGEIVTSSWVGLKCRYGCASYDTNWCCPPAAPDLHKVRALLAEYDLALLLVTEIRGEQFSKSSNPMRRRQIQVWKATVALERKLFLMGYYKAFGMPAESCALCKECAYPDPCKFPKEKRPSVVACSIDMFQTTRKVGHTAKVVRSKTDAYESWSLILLR
jgi:predicted metal-binding protein